MDVGDLSDNPFAVDFSQPRPSRRKAVVSAIKFLVVVAACFAVTLALGWQSRRWIAYRLTHDLPTLSGEAKRARLIQIADLGPLGIQPLVESMADEDLESAHFAYDLLRQSQNGWTLLPREQLQQHHQGMVESLTSIALLLPDDRTVWGTMLLQQTILATVDRADEDSRSLYRDANEAMELFTLSSRSGPSILADAELAPSDPQPLLVTSRPMSLSSADPVGRWTDWPPPAEERSQPTDEPRLQAAPAPTLQHAPSESSPTTTQAPSVYRSASMKLRPVDPSDPIALHDINQPRETAYREPEAATAEIRSVAHLVDSPLEAFDDRSVIQWLDSPHHQLREKAKLELISRGYDGTDLALATQLASGNVQTRVALIDQIARSDSLDPRPWLLMLLEDENREVKLRTVSVLATMRDPTITQRLKMHLVDEKDLTVAHRIRRVLKLP